ncbi:DUF2442 domain-containing protein [candidate division WOR-3 bacterium]|uniref:DUF2442 domain-containing protein n=1 Tax=candidate division WOR-3 bacterium TaxID=2052148 RepID=A0A937XFG8_UNCW3|nr:DUF2442 domain-containing protein [candidate division WOR-3 bacterium]
MTKAHEVSDVRISGTTLTMDVDGRQYRFDLAKLSKRLACATQAQRDRFELSPYGIHWPEIDEDLSIDGLLGIVHAPVNEAVASVADRPRS